VSDIAIQVKGLSKYYRIGKREGYLTLKDSLAKSCRRAYNLFKFQHNRQDELKDTNNSIWALSDVSFEVKKGEIIGIIGRNGAGKTTLLKILSRITEPTEGYAEINGRVGSLLEVGTGFHPELTGRENIYLNGAILGMKRAEIDHKFDNIVAFAEIEKFLDTPVKRYSSGMYVRLAFAVAAHLEPEILMVDEVLAVGDTAFQKKCVGKMGDVAKEGRTVLFVSHNMGAIAQLCHRSLWLDMGRLDLDDNTAKVIQAYLNAMSHGGEKAEAKFSKPKSNIFFTRAAVLDHNGQLCNILDVNKPFYIEVDYSVSRRIDNLEVSIGVFNANGLRVFTCHRSTRESNYQNCNGPGQYTSRVKIPGLFLVPHNYTITIGLHQPHVCSFDRHEHALGFQVVDSGSHITRFFGADVGHVLVTFPWETKQIPG
jgi:lipopolysaccharide transport system ATP-binding protein